MTKKKIVFLLIISVLVLITIFIIKAKFHFGAEYFYKKGFVEMKKADHGDYREKGRLNEAIKYFEEAISKGMKTREVFYYLSFCYLWTDNNINAEKTFTQGLRYYSKDIEFYFYRAECRVELKKFADAILDYDKVVALDSTKKYLASSIYQRGALKFILGYKTEAQSDWDKAFEIAPLKFNRPYVEYTKKFK